jgi:hypothetical protein
MVLWNSKNFLKWCNFPAPSPANYTLKPLFGEKDHDITKEKGPAWTISGIPDRFTSPEDEVPGPGKYDVDQIPISIYKGQRAPTFKIDEPMEILSFKNKHPPKDSGTNQTPATQQPINQLSTSEQPKAPQPPINSFFTRFTKIFSL